MPSDRVITEDEVVRRLSRAERVLLVEPGYRKYIPLGLAKIAGFCRDHNATVEYTRRPEKCEKRLDLALWTTLFTYDREAILNSFRRFRKVYPDVPVVFGGIYATLMPEDLLRETDGDVFSGYSKILDQCRPDYSVAWQASGQWNDFHGVFTSRGCPNACAYCAVGTLEPDIWINPSCRSLLRSDKKYLMISDNNLTAIDGHFEEVMQELAGIKKRVLFNNGVDCKHIDREKADLMARAKYIQGGCRLAFDRIEEDGLFQEAVEKLLDAGIPKYSIMAFVLFNFNDNPQDADYRMRECFRLGIRPYPEPYKPLNQLSRRSTFVGRYWTGSLVQAFRYFWLMRGLYAKGTFEEWARTQTKYRLGPEDMAAWYGEIMEAA